MTELETELLAALKAARRIIIAAVTLGVDIPGFDPAQHSVVRTMDAAIAKAEGTAPDTRCSLCGKPWPFVVPCMWGGCPMGADL